MGLATWDQPLDPYNYQQLSNNWQILDFHDHSPGRGVLINSQGIAVGAIHAANLAGGAVTPAAISGGVQSLAYRAASGAVSANYGDLIVGAASTTVSMPVLASNVYVGIVAGTAVTSATPVVVSGTSFYGGGMFGATSFSLGEPGSYVIFAGNPSYWQVISGIPDSGWINFGATGGAVYGTNMATGSGYNVASRLIGTTVFLRGQLAAGGTIANAATLATMPSAQRPASVATLTTMAILSAATKAFPLQVATSGVLNNASSFDGGLVTGNYIPLDNMSYQLVAS